MLRNYLNRPECQVSRADSGPIDGTALEERIILAEGTLSQRHPTTSSRCIYLDWSPGDDVLLDGSRGDLPIESRADRQDSGTGKQVPAFVGCPHVWGVPCGLRLSPPEPHQTWDHGEWTSRNRRFVADTQVRTVPRGSSSVGRTRSGGLQRLRRVVPRGLDSGWRDTGINGDAALDHLGPECPNDRVR